MARYLGPRCKLSRSVGSDLGLIGIRDGATKCKAARPGQHGQKQRRRTEYGVQLCAKQQIRYYYGVLERQFKRYYAMADRQKGSTGDNLLRLLESRLDNIVYRMGFAITRAEARQLVSHGSIKVNGKKVDIPSYLVSPNDVIEVSDKSKTQLRIALAIEMAKQKTQAHWLDVDAENFRGVFKVYPEAADFPAEFEVNRVVELFSK